MSEDDEVPESQGDVAEIAAPVIARELHLLLDGRLEESHLVDHLLILNTRTQAESIHRIIPLAYCEVCGGAAAHASPSPQSALSADDPPEAVLAALGGWVDPRTGIVSRLALEMPGDDRGPLPIVFTASPPYIVEGQGTLRRLPIGWGKGLTLSGALLSTIGETIERYAASLPDPARLVWSRACDLDGECLDPAAFALYSEEQYARPDFPYRRFDPEVRHPWVPGWWLGSGEPVWVPAVLAFLSLTIRREHQICQGTSNGLAAGTNLEDAALRATLELVERDAFMAAWITASSGCRLETEGALDDELRQVIGGVEALGAAVELYLLDTSACGVAALALAIGDGERYPGVTIGLGADLDPKAAVRGAILELGQTGPHLRRLMRSGAVPVPETPSAVEDMLHHAVYYFPAARTRAFDRLRGSGSRVSLPAGRDRSLAECAASLTAAGVRVALVDVTSPDVATGPFRVVRAVSPDLQGISYGYGLDRAVVERVRRRGIVKDIPEIHPIW
jgi:thiazole/oxazole-forming peptide maturase SagD family component